MNQIETEKKFPMNLLESKKEILKLLLFTLIFGAGFIYFANAAYSGHGVSFHSIIKFPPGSNGAFIILSLISLLFLICTLLMAFFPMIIRRYASKTPNPTSLNVLPEALDFFTFVNNNPEEAIKNIDKLKTETDNKIYKNNLQYLYKDICDEALQKQKQYSLNTIQTQMYNQLCRGEFRFENGDAGYFFHPEKETTLEWVQKQLKPLIDARDVKMTGIFYGQPQYSNGKPIYDAIVFHDSRYSPFVLVQFPRTFSTNRYFYIKHQLNLPDGWFKTGNYESDNFKAKLFDNKFVEFHYKDCKIEEKCLFFALEKLEKYLIDNPQNISRHF